MSVEYLASGILDDVLMAFDDARSAAALRALRDLSRKTQVLVFTDHAHHVAIAEGALTPNEWGCVGSAEGMIRIEYTQGLVAFA